MSIFVCQTKEMAVIRGGGGVRKVCFNMFRWKHAHRRAGVFVQAFSSLYPASALSVHLEHPRRPPCFTVLSSNS